MITIRDRFASIARRLASRTSPLLVVAATFGCSTVEQARFDTPEAAVQAVSDLIGAGDEKRVEQVFGEGSVEMFSSGDEVADREDAQRVKTLITEKVGFEPLDDDSVVVLLGKDEWPFAIPLVRDDAKWRFDSVAGADELTSRRIGRNELHVIATLHALVDAQREYFAESHDGNPCCYAMKLMSSDGMQDGLYWPTADGEPDSPMGEEFAQATDDGYDVDPDQREPFHGYEFRLLTCQGPRAPGGERSYVDEKKLMTGGFAVVAWPVKHGNSGMKTFLVNQLGIVFEKDLGDDTEDAVKDITAFEPDETWDPTADDD